jgi:hypothetical protein
MGSQNQYYRTVPAKQTFHLSVVCKEICLRFKNVSTSPKKARFKIWFHGKNISFNAEFISDNIVIK